MNVVTPRKATTIMLVRDGTLGIEVFMTVRHEAIEFASGALVFPGGRIEDSDHEIAAALSAAVGSAPVPGGDARLDPAMLVAGIRETFEECGILLARPVGSESLVDEALRVRIDRAHREAVNADPARFAELLAQEALVPALDLLVPFAHWITPPGQRKRYDTLFLLAEAPAGQTGRHDGAEAVDSVWITPAEAISGTEAGRYKMLFPTHLNLSKLGRHACVADALAAARASRLVTVQPEMLSSQDGVRQMRIPEEAGYGGAVFTTNSVPGIT